MITDRRIFTFYVNPHTNELCAVEGMSDRMREALKGQGVTQMGSWFVADAWNWGVAAIMKWQYEKVAKSARHWHKAAEHRREQLARLKRKVAQGGQGGQGGSNSRAK